MGELDSLSPQNLNQLRIALANGKRDFPGLQLSQADGLDLDLSNCELQGSCFKEARFGYAQLSNANVQQCCFQEALLWG
ncbi:MAG: pentapeptide repeat-containing protein, partial [Prochlorococcus sp.]